MTITKTRKTKLKKIILALFFGLAITNSCTLSPTTSITNNIYYVDGSLGSDSNTGSKAQPWRTIRNTADRLSPGDTIKIISGDYPERVVISNSGTSENPITFEAEGVVTMHGFTVNADNIIIRNFEINETGDDSTAGWGIYIQGNNCIIEGNYIHNATRGGVLISPSTNNCLIRNNRLYRNSQVGIEVNGSNHLIDGNEIWETIQYHPKWKNPPSWVDADGIRFFGSGHTFSKNYIHDISIDDPQNVNPHIDAFQTWDNQKNQVGINCIFNKNKIILGKSATGFQIEGGASNLIIMNNIVNAFRGILAYKNGEAPYTSPSNIFVLNDAFIGDIAYLIEEDPLGLLIGDTTNIVIKNNLITEQHGQTIEIYSSTYDIGHNLFYNSDESTPLGTPYANDVWGMNPLFINQDIRDFHLQAESPAIDAGISLESVTHDLDEVLRPQGNGFDIGPYEYIP